MVKPRQISEKAASKAKEEDLRRLANWNEKTYNYSEPRDWSQEDRAKVIDYLQCQLIVSMSWGG